MKPKVLVLDDERSLRVILCDNLRMDGYPVVAAESGRQALELAAKERPDIAVIDIGLPDMDGWEVLRRLEETPQTQDIPVILLSGNFGDEINAEPARTGKLHFMAKPYEYSDLLELIERVLQGKS